MPLVEIPYIPKYAFWYNVLQIIYRAEDIVTYHLTLKRLAGADLIIRPKVHLSRAAVDQIEKIITAGERPLQKRCSRFGKF